MPGPHTGSFRPSRGGPGWEIRDWRGDEIEAKMIEASRRAIDWVSGLAAEEAKEEHPWDDETFQTRDAVFWERAKFEPRYGTMGPHVWGEWGVREYAREPVRRAGRSGGPYDRALTTLDVAMFLEFGTVNMFARPWLYPAWDRTKVLLPGLVKSFYDALSALPVTGSRLRSPSGTFLKTSDFLP